MNNQKTNIIQNFYSGLSGLVLPVPKYLYPEAHRDSSRLTYYSSFFNSIEINSTFYRLPMQKTISKWCSLVGDDFKFTVKLWKEITHSKNLEFKENDVELFLNSVASAEHKKCCILIQLPPSTGKIHIMQLEALLRCITQARLTYSWKIAVEFRNKSWYCEDVYSLIKKHNATIVIQDIPKSLTPMMSHTADFIYLRFHGPTGNYRGSYSDSFLNEYATYIKEWLNEGKMVHAYFNNTMGDAFKNLQTLNECIINQYTSTRNSLT